MHTVGYGNRKPFAIEYIFFVPFFFPIGVSVFIGVIGGSLLRGLGLRAVSALH
jgi:uncharacterized integral membrane protein